MPTTTTNLALYKPLVNDPVDADLWGGYLNQNADTLDGEAATWTINKNGADKTLSRPLLKDYGEIASTGNSISGATAIDIAATGNHYVATMTGNVTFTFTNPSPTGNACPLLIVLSQNATGGFTASWPAAVAWAGAVAPTITSTASKTDIYSFITYDAGTKWYGSVVNQNYA